MSGTKDLTPTFCISQTPVLVVEFTDIAIHRIEDGIITEAEMGFDLFNLMRQIGAR